MGLPRRVADVLEGESLVNDATGLLALEFGVLILAWGTVPSLSYAAFRFCYLVVCGIAVGLLLGVVVDWFERRIDDGPIEIAISLLVPYGAYLIADALHASGVLESRMEAQLAEVGLSLAKLAALRQLSLAGDSLTGTGSTQDGKLQLDLIGKGKPVRYSSLLAAPQP